MAKPLRIGTLLDVNAPVPLVVEQLRRFADAGLDHAFAAQIFGHDALTLLAVAGAQVPGIELGTGVVPIYPRHPMMLAQQALTVQSATGNRLILGIGLSHQVVVESIWGLSFERPATYMKEYLDSLMPLMEGKTVTSAGERVSTNAFMPLDVKDVPPPTTVLAALGPTMLRMAGTIADGTITWMTGMHTVADHIAPTIQAAASEAGRPEPRIIVSLPVSVTAGVGTVKELTNKELAIYPTLPSYRAMLDKEGAEGPADVGIFGDEDHVRAGVEKLAGCGATDFVGLVIGNKEERDRTLDVLSDIARS